MNSKLKRTKRTSRSGGNLKKLGGKKQTKKTLNPEATQTYI